MKTTRSIHICPVCQFRINTYGYPCSSLLELSIDYHSRNIPLTINENLIYDRLFKVPLQYMEAKGFLVSTEISDTHVQILPNLRKGRHDDEKGYLCWC